MIDKNITGYAQQYYLPAEQGLIQAASDHANYWYIDGSLPEEYPEKWDAQRVSTLVQKIQQYNIKPIFHGNFKLPLASDASDIREAAVKRLFSEINLSAELSAPLIIHGGAIVEPRLVIKAKKEALNHYIKSLEMIISHAEKKGVTLLLENLCNYKNYRPFHYIFTTPEEYKYVFDRIDDKHVRFFFDVGHGAVCDGDPAAVLEEFHDRIWGMSFSNNDGIRDLHLGIDHGIIDYKNIVNTIIRKNWRGVLAFEVRGRSFRQCVDDVKNLFEKSALINSHRQSHTEITNL